MSSPLERAAIEEEIAQIVHKDGQVPRNFSHTKKRAHVGHRALSEGQVADHAALAMGLEGKLTDTAELAKRFEEHLKKMGTTGVNLVNIWRQIAGCITNEYLGQIGYNAQTEGVGFLKRDLNRMKDNIQAELWPAGYRPHPFSQEYPPIKLSNGQAYSRASACPAAGSSRKIIEAAVQVIRTIQGRQQSAV